MQTQSWLENHESKFLVHIPSCDYRESVCMQLTACTFPFSFCIHKRVACHHKCFLSSPNGIIVKKHNTALHSIQYKPPSAYPDSVLMAGARTTMYETNVASVGRDLQQHQSVSHWSAAPWIRLTPLTSCETRQRRIVGCSIKWCCEYMSCIGNIPVLVLSVVVVHPVEGARSLQMWAVVRHHHGRESWVQYKGRGHDCNPCFAELSSRCGVNIMTLCDVMCVGMFLFPKSAQYFPCSPILHLPWPPTHDGERSPIFFLSLQSWNQTHSNPWLYSPSYGLWRAEPGWEG